MSVDHAHLGFMNGHDRHALNKFGSHKAGSAADGVDGEGRVVFEIAQPVGRTTPQWDEAEFRTEAVALAREYNQEHGPIIDHVTFWTNAGAERHGIL